MARKARRIPRPQPKRPHPTYCILLARQLATNRAQSWFDALPHDLQTLIWQHYYKNCKQQIREFYQYRSFMRCMIRQRLKSPSLARHGRTAEAVKSSAFSNRRQLLLLTDSNQVVAAGRCEHELHQGLFNVPASWTDPQPYQSAIGANTCGLVNEDIIDTFEKLYNLCKPVPPEWSNLPAPFGPVAAQTINLET